MTKPDFAPTAPTPATDPTIARRLLHRACLVAFLVAAALSGCRDQTPSADGPSQLAVTDAVYQVLSADREAYAEEVVHRLQDVEKVMKAGEQWKEDKLLPLPAQMFRMGAARVQKRDTGLSYALLSLWPINKQNAPRTELEKAGLQAVVDQPGQRFSGEEVLGAKRFFVAVYPDKAVSVACATCHNGHADSPRTDFKPGDVMGGIVIRVAQR
jgi:hypothetical protein